MTACNVDLPPQIADLDVQFPWQIGLALRDPDTCTMVRLRIAAHPDRLEVGLPGRASGPSLIVAVWGGALRVTTWCDV